MLKIDSLRNLYDDVFNIKFAAISAPTNGLIAALVNSSHGTLETLAAGGTQALSSFLSTGFTARLVQHFSPIRNVVASYVLGSIVPATATFAISYAGHYINETPERLESCIAPTLISLSTSLVTNFITRRGYLLPNNYPTDLDSPRGS